MVHTNFFCETMNQEIDNLKKLAGIDSANSFSEIGSNISITGSEKARIQRERNIKPGTVEWFRLWFSLPLLTGPSKH